MYNEKRIDKLFDNIKKSLANKKIEINDVFPEFMDQVNDIVKELPQKADSQVETWINTKGQPFIDKTSKLYFQSLKNGNAKYRKKLEAKLKDDEFINANKAIILADIDKQKKELLEARKAFTIEKNEFLESQKAVQNKADETLAEAERLTEKVHSVKLMSFIKLGIGLMLPEILLVWGLFELINLIH